MAATTTADTATTVAVEELEAAEAVEEYESDPEEVKRSLAMRRRREASDDEDDEESGERGKMDRAPVHSDYESDGQGAAPADYDDEFEEEEEDYEDEELEVEVYEEEEGRQVRGIYAETKVKAVEDTDGEGRMDGAVDEALRNNDNEKNDVTEETDEGKKESNEPFAVPTAGAFYMHDDRFRDNAGGRHRYNLLFPVNDMLMGTCTVGWIYLLLYDLV